MASVSVQEYPVPLFDGTVWKCGGKKYRWSNGRWSLCGQHAQPSRRDLEKRLENLRHVKLELEESNDRRKQIIKDLTVRLENVNQAMYSKEVCYKELFKSEEQMKRARLRMKELGKRILQTTNDYDRLHGEVEKYRKEFRCSTCKQVKKVECFGKDVDQPTGYDNRCRLCLREKTKQWRAAKKLIQQ